MKPGGDTVIWPPGWQLLLCASHCAKHLYVNSFNFHSKGINWGKEACPPPQSWAYIRGGFLSMCLSCVPVVCHTGKWSPSPSRTQNPPTSYPGRGVWTLKPQKWLLMCSWSPRTIQTHVQNHGEGLESKVWFPWPYPEQPAFRWVTTEEPTDNHLPSANEGQSPCLLSWVPPDSGQLWMVGSFLSGLDIMPSGGHPGKPCYLAKSSKNGVLFDSWVCVTQPLLWHKAEDIEHTMQNAINWGQEAGEYRPCKRPGNMPLYWRPSQKG